MSSQSWGSRGHLLEFTEENMSKFKLADESKFLFDIIAEAGPQAIENGDPDVEEFLDAFKNQFGIRPEFVYIDDEVEGCSDNIEIDTLYLLFEDEDKYIKTIQPEWKALPVEPDESSWTFFG